MNYVIWGHLPDPTLCSLKSPEGLPDAYQLCYGVAREAGFPPNVLFRMNPEFKRAIKLADALANDDFLIVASRRLKDFLEQQNLPANEYLRVTIYNHKNRVASDDYYIVNQVGTQDCIDRQKSVMTWNLINPEQISGVDKLVLEESRIDPAAALFRAKHLPTKIFARRDLADKILAGGFTGIVFTEVADFTQV